MRKSLITLILSILSFTINGQGNDIDQSKIAEDFEQLLGHLSQFYVYGKDKKVDFNYLITTYRAKIKTLKSKEETTLFFEYFLDEFYDSHLILNTNTQSSYRLWAPLYVILQEEKFIITNVWQSQIKSGLSENIIGAEILKFNGQVFNTIINNFPTHCNNKAAKEVREWVANKTIAGRYNEPRKLTLKLQNNETYTIDLDSINYKKTNNLVSSSKIGDIGIIRINNSLGKDELVAFFDKTLDSLMDTKGLILDLRNTVDGGDAYEARGIMGRFIDKAKPYQKHAVIEYSRANPDIERSWVEYVTPRLTTYTKPVLVLVGRWTGSMGEGLAVGFEGMERGEVIGTEMERLAGEIFFFPFKNQNYGYRIPAAKLFHLNGTPREKYVPTNYIKETTNKNDELLNKALSLMNSKI